MTLPPVVLPFASPVAGMADGVVRNTVRGNDNILRERLNAVRDYVGQDKSATAHVSTDTTLDADADGGTVLVDATSGNLTVTLPLAADASDRRYTVKKIDVSANTVTIDGDGAETIDGSATQVLTTQYARITVQCDGSAWWILS
jgi:hypothetical protein